MNRQRLQFCTSIFLSEMRRQAVKSGSLIEIKALEDYPAEQRSALMAGIERAIRAADPAADDTFKTWADRQQSPTVT